MRLCVEACGVCHSDAGTVEALFPIDWPRVPGHELVGRIDALGSGVQGWALGQRVGVGFLGGACGYCEFCRSGDLVNCRNQEYTGIRCISETHCLRRSHRTKRRDFEVTFCQVDIVELATLSKRCDSRQFLRQR